MSLHNKTILITRRLEQARGMIAEVERLGGRALACPAIEVVDPLSWEPVDSAIALLDRYDAVVVASANAAERFLRRCNERGAGLDALHALRWHAVGERTRVVLKHAGLPVGEIPVEYSSGALAGLLDAAQVRGKRLLIPRGDRASEDLPDGLRAKGGEVDTVVVYRTVRPSGQPDGAARRRILAASVDAITFASPTAVEYFLELFSPDEVSTLLAHAAVAVIGPTTGEAARRAGFAVAVVARESTGIGLIRALDAYYS